MMYLFFALASCAPIYEFTKETWQDKLQMMNGLSSAADVFCADYQQYLYDKNILKSSWANTCYELLLFKHFFETTSELAPFIKPTKEIHWDYHAVEKSNNSVPILSKTGPNEKIVVEKSNSSVPIRISKTGPNEKNYHKNNDDFVPIRISKTGPNEKKFNQTKSFSSKSNEISQVVNEKKWKHDFVEQKNATNVSSQLNKNLESIDKANSTIDLGDTKIKEKLNETNVENSQNYMEKTKPTPPSPTNLNEITKKLEETMNNDLQN